MKDQTNRQEILILKSHEESNTTKLKLTEAMQKVGLLEVETYESKQNLEQAIAEFRKVEEERRMLAAMVSENHEAKLLVKEKEKESRKQMESVIFVVQELLKEVFDFEHRVIDYISRNNERYLTNTLISCSGIIVVTWIIGNLQDCFTPLILRHWHGYA